MVLSGENFYFWLFGWGKGKGEAFHSLILLKTDLTYQTKGILQHVFFLANSLQSKQQRYTSTYTKLQNRGMQLSSLEGLELAIINLNGRQSINWQWSHEKNFLT